jgi:hypothetical protein
MSGLVLRSLLDASIRISVVGAAVGLILIALRIRASGARRTAWTVVLCGMLAMPLLPYCVPVVRIPVPELTRRTWATAEMVRLSFPTGPVGALPIAPPVVSPAPEPTASARFSEWSLPRAPIWSVVALTMYVLGALLSFARFARGWRAAQRIARSSQPIAAAQDRLSLCDPGEDWRETHSMLRSDLCESIGSSAASRVRSCQRLGRGASPPAVPRRSSWWWPVVGHYRLRPRCDTFSRSPSGKSIDTRTASGTLPMLT